MIRGKELLRLIPQRKPFVMIDALGVLSPTSATSTLLVRPSNYFLLPDSTLSETALVEHVAQTCSALMGYKQGALDREGEPPVGLIGEVKHFESLRRVRLGERVRTQVSFGFTFGNVTIANGECRVDNEVVARVQLKIFMQS
ncbi:MAG: beta-hydroxyacyl-ACP dehydratase [Bacteroidaceae bacterium]|nr:beta-hydroxyacyl-ACP dehydratase [Bacteroidaceae bacterium]